MPIRHYSLYVFGKLKYLHVHFFLARIQCYRTEAEESFFCLQLLVFRMLLRGDR